MQGTVETPNSLVANRPLNRGEILNAREVGMLNRNRMLLGVGLLFGLAGVRQEVASAAEAVSPHGCSTCVQADENHYFENNCCMPGSGSSCRVTAYPGHGTAPGACGIHCYCAAQN